MTLLSALQRTTRRVQPRPLARSYQSLRRKQVMASVLLPNGGQSSVQLYRGLATRAALSSTTSPSPNGEGTRGYSTTILATACAMVASFAIAVTTSNRDERTDASVPAQSTWSEALSNRLRQGLAYTACEDDVSDWRHPSYGQTGSRLLESSLSVHDDDAVSFVLSPLEPTVDRTVDEEDPSSNYSKSVRACARSFQATEEEEREDNDAHQQEQHGDDETLSSPNVVPTATSSKVLLPSLLDHPSTRNHHHHNSNHVTTKKMYFYHHPVIEQWRADKFVLLAGPSSHDLGEDIGHLLQVPVNSMDIGQFTDGETRVQVQDSVRGKTVFVVQSTTSTDAVMELLLLISALRRASAKNVTVVIPYYGYCRQDVRRMREPIAAADVADMLEIMGCDRVICMDLHNDSLSGFFNAHTSIEHLMPAPVAAAYFFESLSSKETPEETKDDETAATDCSSDTVTDDDNFPKSITVVASHEGQVGRATQFRSVLQRLSGQQVELAVLTKNKVNEGEDRYRANLVGNVKGRTCIIIDDIVTTGTTMVSNVETLKLEGAHKIYGWATHGVFGSSSVATERLQASEGLEYLLISNSVSQTKELPPKIRSLNVAPLLAEGIARVLHNQSVSNILNMEKFDPGQEPRYDS